MRNPKRSVISPTRAADNNYISRFPSVVLLVLGVKLDGHTGKFHPKMRGVRLVYTLPFWKERRQGFRLLPSMDLRVKTGGTSRIRLF